MGDQQLDNLIEKALLHAPDLEVAQARMASAQSQRRLDQAATGLQASASGGVSRQRLSDDGLISSKLIGFNWYSDSDTDVQLAWDLDWWGRERAGVEASVDREHAIQAERQAAELAVVSSLVLNYLNWQTAAAQLRIVESELSNLEARRGLEAQRISAGIDDPQSIDRLDLERARRAESRDQIRALQSERLLAIAALLAVAPEGLPELDEKRFSLSGGIVPADAGIELMARRPDLVADRWRVESAAQAVEQARAAYYPDVRLSALAGLSSIDVTKLFNAGNGVPGIGARVYLPIFDLRTVRARYGVSQAQLNLAVAEYDQRIVFAAHEVSSAITTLRQLEDRRVDIGQRVAAVDRQSESIASQAAQGLVDRREELWAQNERSDTQIDALLLEGECSVARLALIAALGGGVATPAPPQRVSQLEKAQR